MWRLNMNPFLLAGGAYVMGLALGVAIGALNF